MAAPDTSASDPGPRFQAEGFGAEMDRFVRAYPAYARTASLDDLREREYGHLDEREQVYLDYAGASLHSRTQLEVVHGLLSGRAFGNPHSYGPASIASSEHVDGARRRVLAFFGLDPAEYVAIFTPNATGAIRLVGEAFPFDADGYLLLSRDNHNSVNGLQQWACARGARVAGVPVRRADLTLDPAEVVRALDEGAAASGARLFAFPAQSNFSGAQHPLDLVERARERGFAVLLDAAAFAPTNRLDFGRVKPDFVPLSFYKLFGFPTGVGVLLARHEALARLRRPWSAGGSVAFASALDPSWRRLASGESGFEDGTVNYLGIAALPSGLDLLERAGLGRVHERVGALTAWLLDAMSRCRHSNGRPLFRVLGPPGTEGRGATVALQLLDPEGVVHDGPLVERLAAAAHISLRTGCFCNPGAAEAAQGLGLPELAAVFDNASAGWSSLEYRHAVRERTGATLDAIRVSFGIASNFADAWWFMAFCAAFRDVAQDALLEHEVLPSCCA